MKKTARTHLDRGPATEITSAVAHRYLCRPRDFLPPDRVTQDEGAVTCGSCLRMIAEGRAPTVPVETFEPSGPYTPPRGATELDARDRARIEHEGEDEPLRVPFPSLDRALETWFAYRLASKVRTGPVVEGADKKNESRIDRLDRDDRARAVTSDRALIEGHASVRHVEAAVEVACAGGVAFAGGADGVGALAITEDACRRIAVWYLDGKSAGMIAERVATILRLADAQVTPHQIGLAWRELRRRMAAELIRRGAVARAREIAYDGGQGQAEGAGMRIDSFDCEGWAQISSALGCSESHARGLASAPTSDPMPVVRVGSRVRGKTSDLRAWAARQAKPYQRAGAA